MNRALCVHQYVCLHLLYILRKATFANQFCFTEQASFHSKEFAFEKVFHGASTQDDVYAHFRRTAERILTGQDSCVLSFGPKNSGKTHTMFGPSVANGKQDNYWNAAFDVASVYGNPSLLGVVQKSFASIFARLAERKQEKYRVVLSVKELYNDKLQ